MKNNTKRPYMPSDIDQQGRYPRLPFEWEDLSTSQKVLEVVCAVLIFAIPVGFLCLALLEGTR
jgi:hypothetical protein